ncbi:MAG: DUF819 family protein [Desulfobacteraceae bacterium]|nr:DUF819 family protein [Desulfobacteraceae bacterium]
MMILTAILFYLLLPAFIIFLCQQYPVFDKIGAVIICYLIGMTIGNINILPQDILPIQETITQISIGLALPLLLFSLDIRQWITMAGSAMISMVLATISVTLISGSVYWILMDQIHESWKVAGMAIGAYTGGTPNIAAIKTALAIDPNIFIQFHTYDILISAIYLIFVMTVGQKIFSRFLPRTPAITRNIDPENTKTHDNLSSYEGIFKTQVFFPLVKVSGLSLLILLTAAGVAKAVPKEYGAVAAIITITTLGLAGAFIPKIQKTKKSFQAGMYIILVFCLVVGSMARIDKIISINIPLFQFVTMSIFGSLFLHALLCRFFKIDTDTFLIVSTATICSPPLVPPVAAALKNKEILLSGLTTGIIGYAIGNYLGIFLAYFFHSMTI